MQKISFKWEDHVVYKDCLQAFVIIQNFVIHFMMNNVFAEIVQSKGQGRKQSEDILFIEKYKDFTPNNYKRNLDKGKLLPIEVIFR